MTKHRQTALSSSCPSSLSGKEKRERIERVAFVTTKLVLGGAERVITLLAKTLAKEGVEVLCVCLESLGELGEYLASDGVQVLALDSHRSRDLSAIHRLAKILRNFAPTVINVHDRASLPYVVAANVLGPCRPVIFSAHGFLFRDIGKAPWKYRIPAKWLTAFTAESANVGARYSDHLHWRGSIDIVPNGVPVPDLTGLVRAPARDRLNVTEDTFAFISVGNMKPEKGFEDLLDAAAQLRDKQPDRRFVCWVVGAPAESDYHKKLLVKHRALDLENVVEFLGFRPDLVDLYQAADAFLLPSRSEGLPMVLLEAMMYGLPVIVTRVGAIPDVVTAECGLTVRVGAPDQLCSAMSRVVTSPVLVKQMGENSRTRAVTEYSVDRMTSQYLETFARVARQ